MSLGLRKTVKDIIDDRTSRRSLLADSLAAVGTVYGGAVRLRTAAYEKGLVETRRLPCAVVSVGNLTVGGTGKTPLTMFLARLLQSWGWRTVVVSRGYGGTASAKGGIASDGHRIRMSSTECGDEPAMMAAMLPGIPVIVDRRRHRGGRLAVDRFQAQVVLLDDAFQHLQLHRDLNLVLMDSARPLGNGRLLPGGPLREPAWALERADAVIWTRRADRRSESVPHGGCKGLIRTGRPQFSCRHVPGRVRLYARRSSEQWTPELPPEVLGGRRIFAFSAIADNRGFRETLDKLGARIVGYCDYPDHHRYSLADIEAVGRKAAVKRAALMVTTEKDFARIGHRWSEVTRCGDAAVLGIRIDFGPDQRRFEAFLRRRLER